VLNKICMPTLYYIYVHMPRILLHARFTKRLILGTYEYDNLHCFFYNILYCAVHGNDRREFLFSPLIHLHKPCEFVMISDTYKIIIWFNSYGMWLCDGRDTVYIFIYYYFFLGGEEIILKTFNNECKMFESCFDSIALICRSAWKVWILSHKLYLCAFVHLWLVNANSIN